MSGGEGRAEAAVQAGLRIAALESALEVERAAHAATARVVEAIAEAAIRPTMRFVALKSEAQLDAQVLH